MINFLKYRWIYFLISTIVIGVGLFSIFKWGYRYSIDFTGGTNIDYQFSKNVDTKLMNGIVKEMKIQVLSQKTEKNRLTMKTKVLDEETNSLLKNSLENNLKAKITVLKYETVGPTLGKEAIRKTLIASVLAIIGILIYMSFAFKGFNFAFSAVIAMFHDLLVVVGSYSLLSHFFGAEVDTMFVTAVLTTMSFSVHDTIVIFDKIREYHNEQGSLDPESAANRSLTETMVRSLNNSMTIVFMLLALTLMGGSTIRFFILTLLIGTVTGTYSSPFIATPVLVWLEKIRKQK
ncbi:MAG: protein translocase subunit SecF [Candidatus Roizmanbacteria bacterium]|nr:protein translocase subunit SecF [Candidatus Roizmanbacteria bacterium]MCR4313273.1 protein translocase subunit SecF [Candidatus Roizmanbacteria bacterium]